MASGCSGSMKQKTPVRTSNRRNGNSNRRNSNRRNGNSKRRNSNSKRRNSNSNRRNSNRGKSNRRKSNSKRRNSNAKSAKKQRGGSPAYRFHQAEGFLSQLSDFPRDLPLFQDGDGADKNYYDVSV